MKLFITTCMVFFCLTNSLGQLPAESLYWENEQLYVEKNIQFIAHQLDYPVEFLLNELPYGNFSVWQAQDRSTYFYFNTSYLRFIRTQSPSLSIAVICVLAHEFGHVLLLHSEDGKGSTIAKELDADFMAGYICFLVGLQLDEATMGIRYLIENRYDTPTHPAKHKRLHATQNGWKAAAQEVSISGVNTSKRYFLSSSVLGRYLKRK